MQVQKFLGNENLILNDMLPFREDKNTKLIIQMSRYGTILTHNAEHQTQF